MGGALGARDQARGGRRRDHQLGEPLDRRAGEDPRSASPTPRASSCRADGRPRPASAGRRPISRGASEPWPTTAPRPSTAASSPSGSSSSSSREGAPFEPGDFARQLDETFVYAPIATDYRGLRVHQTAPVTQGLLLLSQLNLLEGFDLRKLPLVGTDRVHLTIEAKKLAFEDRNRHAGDPAFVKWPLEELIGKDHAARRRAEIDLGRARMPEGALVPEHDGDTSYFAVVDAEGNAVSFIHSLSAAFGSGVVAGDTGITLNNRAGRGFSLDERHPNVIAPGKRTMHTLNAFLVCQDGQPWLVGGTPGGDQQTQWSTQVITSMVDHGLSPQEAVEAPRWFSFPGTDPVNLGLPAVVRLEERVPEATRRELAARGHVIETLGPWSGGGAVQLIQVDRERGVLRGGSDPRPGGVALGL